MNDDSKNDDWGMTMPNFRYEEEKKKAAESFAPSPYDAAPEPPPAPVDDWGMTQANVQLPKAAPQNPQPPSQPFGDFDKTTPNINISSNFSEPAPRAPSHDDWGMTEPNLQIPKEARHDDWSAPGQPKKDDWQMPQPVFRISSGETPSFDKTTPNFNLKNNAGDFASDADEIAGHTTPYYRLPENQAPAAAVVAEPPPVSEQFSAAEVAEKPAAAQSSGNMKWILLLGGLFAFFMIVIAALIAGYYFFMYDSATIKSAPANKTEPATAPPTPAPTSAPAVTTTDAALPAAIVYKGDMVLVAAGDFTMGSDAGADEARPAHQVTLPAFYIDKTEVTNAQYKAFCDATGKQPPPDPFWEKGYFARRPNAPVLGVSYDDAKAYAAWAGKRLPTEAEWEKAASWNAQTKTKTDFPWGAAFDGGKAAFGLATPKDAGSYPAGASPAGALDMAGNVAEWVDAFFQPYPGNTSANPNFGETNRVVRGGHFGSKASDFLMTTRRIYVPPTIASGEDEGKLFAAAIGFRCAVSADDPRVAETLKK